MIRARFKANVDDYRPVSWPVNHPYWCTGYDYGFSVVVSYADSLDELMKLWPEATEVDYEEVDCYSFSERFPKPEWFER